MGVYWAEIADENATERQIQFLKSTLKKDGWFLDLACGTGRHTIPLVNNGYNVVGLDASLKLLKIAKQRQVNVQLVQADMRYLPFADEVFGTAVSMDNSFGYLPTEESDLQSLKELNRILGIGGLFVLDVFNCEQLSQKYERSKNLRWWFLPVFLRFNNGLSRRILFWLYRWRKYPSFFLLQKRTVSKNEGLLRDLWVVNDKSNEQNLIFNHVSRLYTRNRTQELLVEANFLAIQIYGNYEKQNFNANSNRLIFLSEAKK